MTETACREGLWGDLKVLHFTQDGTTYGQDNVLPFSPELYSRVGRVEAPSTSYPPLVVLPGFGNQSSDYTEPLAPGGECLSASLRSRGFRPFVVGVSRKDWFRIARGLLTIGFWRAANTTNPGYTWWVLLAAAPALVCLVAPLSLCADPPVP